MQRSDPEFFERLAAQQAPEYLWIGCSDSRVPATQIVGLPPGEMFVHRNVANLVVAGDLNGMSAIQFAVDVLRVRHIIVCGHYGCGGVLAALRGERHGLVDEWLRHVRELRDRHRGALDALPGEDERAARLCELNVIEQVGNVANSEIVRGAWARGQRVAVSGCIYDIRDGLLKHLDISVSREGELPAAAELVRHELGSGVHRLSRR